MGLLSLVRYRLTREASLPVIGVAMLCAGAMDGFHTFGADRLVEATADNNDDRDAELGGQFSQMIGRRLIRAGVSNDLVERLVAATADWNYFGEILAVRGAGIYRYP